MNWRSEGVCVVEKGQNKKKRKARKYKVVIDRGGGQR